MVKGKDGAVSADYPSPFEASGGSLTVIHKWMDNMASVTGPHRQQCLEACPIPTSAESAAKRTALVEVCVNSYELNGIIPDSTPFEIAVRRFDVHRILSLLNTSRLRIRQDFAP